MSDDGRTTGDEKPTSGGKAEVKSYEDLMEVVKKQVQLKKKLEAKIAELTAFNVSLCQTGEEARNKLEDEQLETKRLQTELEQYKINESKLQQEVNKNREASECLQLQNESLKSSCKYLQEELSNVQSNLSNLRSTTGNLEEDLTTRLTVSQDTIENLLNEKQQFEEEKVQWQQSMEKLQLNNEKLKADLDDLRSKSETFEEDKQSMEEQINHLRKQVEEFESQKIEFEKLQQQSSDADGHQNIEQTVSDHLTALLSEERHQNISKELSDIPAMLSSIGISDYQQEDFLHPVQMESVLRLCALLIERCRVLQSQSISSEQPRGKESISMVESDGNTQCRLVIHRQEHAGLDAFFEHLYSSLGQSNDSDDWQINLVKPLDQNADQYIRLELNNLTFITEQVEGDLTQTRAHRDQLSREIATLQESLQGSQQLEEQLDQQRQKIDILEAERQSFEQLKHQFTEQQEKIDAFEEDRRLLEQQREEIETLKRQLQSFEQSADQQNETTVLQEKLRSAENQLSEQRQEITSLQEEREKTRDLQETLNQDQTKREQLESSFQELQQKYLLLENIQSEYDLLEGKFSVMNQELTETRDTNAQLKLDSERQQLYLLERDENIHLLKLKVEQNHEQDERCASLSKQVQQYCDAMETKTNENKQLTDRVAQLEDDLKENKQLLFETSKQADDLDRQLQVSIGQCDDLKTQFERLNDERNKLIEQIGRLEKEKSDYAQINDNLQQELKNSKLNYEQTVKTNSEKVQMEEQLQQTIQTLQQELDTIKTNIQEQQTKGIEEKQATLENEITNLQQEKVKLTETITDLNQKNEKQTAEIDDLKDKQQRMKLLLARLKKELQEKTQQQPKQSLIDLELADYEKTIKTLKDDLTQKDKEIQDLRDDLTNINEKNLALKQEMENLDQQKLQTEERANKFKTLLETTKKELLDAKDLEQERHQNEDNVRSLIDKLQAELDDHKVTVSQLLAEKQQLTERLNNQNETMQRTINLLEQNLRIAKHELDVAKQDHETLQDEYNNYQIRAKSVLKQHQSTQRERMPSVVDKQAELEETIEKLKATLQETHEKAQLLRSENEALQKEQDRLTEIQSKFVSEAKKREQDLRKQHQIELQKMESECLQRTNDTHDMMKDVTLQNETLSTAFKEQISAIEADHERSISMLQNQLQAAKQEIEQLKSRIEALRQISVENEKETSQVGLTNEVNKDDLPWTNAERQQGEGSESASSDHQSTDVAVKTLENVLFGNSSNNNRSLSTAEKPRHVLFEDAEVERQRIEEELNKTKYRLLNTTELLNESELNNVRLSEQVALLKEEIRRMERNIDRTESISNLEYLKNVILKFFVLKTTYERLQLIPVLVTMLKLSPDEQAKLVRVAQETSSIDGSPVNNESNGSQDTNANPSASSSSSWSSYLNIW